jgi:hypothetical protein
MVDKGTIVLRFDSRTRRDERNAKIAKQINQLCLDNPDLVSEYHMLIDESTLIATQHGLEYVSFEQMLQDIEHMPRISPARVNDAARFSERLRAIERVPLERASQQPKPSRLSEALQALEAQYGNRDYN